MALANAADAAARSDAMRALVRAAHAYAVRSGRQVDLTIVREITAQSLMTIAATARRHLLRCATLAESHVTLIKALDDDAEERFQAARQIQGEPLEFPPIRGPRQLRWNMQSGRYEHAGVELDLWSSLIDALVSLKEPSRLRACRICENIFWAQRMDSVTCCPQHAQTWRTRRYYNRHIRLSRSSDEES